MQTKPNRPRRRNARLVSYQTPEQVNVPSVEDTTVSENEENGGDEEESNIVEEKPWGSVKRGYFSIKVLGEDKKAAPLYENKKEEFKYDQVNSLVNALVYSGAKLNDSQIQAFGQALTNSEDAEIDKTIGEAVTEIVRTFNTKLKADAKSSAYQTLVNKYKPLEGEKRKTAIARTINNLVKLAGISAESAIEVLKSKKAVPEDYTVDDYKATPLRRTKDEDDDLDDE